MITPIRFKAAFKAETDAANRIDGDGKTDPKLVKTIFADFQNGKISFDKLLADLNAQVGGPEKADGDGGTQVNCTFLGGVSLAMKKIGQGWTSMTYYAVPPENLDWDLAGKQVRLGSTSPAVTASRMKP